MGVEVAWTQRKGEEGAGRLLPAQLADQEREPCSCYPRHDLRKPVHPEITQLHLTSLE